MMFEEKVRELCRKIPKGRVTTYKAIADALGTRAYRAVGNALRKNSCKDVPCHRVVKSDLSVGGYRGRKSSRKKIVMLKKDGVRIRKGKVEERFIYPSASLSS